MSAGVVIDTEDWLGAGGYSVGEHGFGVPGSSIPATGASGPGYAFNDLSLPADAGKEICGAITAWPLYGDLYAYEDTGFVYTRTASGDGVDSFQYQLYVDHAAIGAPVTVPLTVGEPVSVAPGATLVATSSIVGGAATGSTGGVSASAPGALLTATSSILPGAATGGTGSVSAMAPGATLTATASIRAGAASSGNYARSPPGAGYTPRRVEHQYRPAAIQRNHR